MEDTTSSNQVLRGHKEAVLSVCISGSGEVVVSGGQDDTALVWDAHQQKVLFRCDGHKDSVTCVGISCKETYVGTGDMSGYIQVWKSEDGNKIFEYEADGDLQWMSWHPVLDAVIICGTQVGNIFILKVTDVSQIKMLPGFGCATTAAKITKCGTKIFAGYEDGSLRLWDMKSGQVIHAVKG